MVRQKTRHLDTTKCLFCRHLVASTLENPANLRPACLSTNPRTAFRLRATITPLRSRRVSSHPIDSVGLANTRATNHPVVSHYLKQPKRKKLARVLWDTNRKKVLPRKRRAVRSNFERRSDPTNKRAGKSLKTSRIETSSFDRRTKIR